MVKLGFLITVECWTGIFAACCLSSVVLFWVNCHSQRYDCPCRASSWVSSLNWGLDPSYLPSYQCMKSHRLHWHTNQMLFNCNILVYAWQMLFQKHVCSITISLGKPSTPSSITIQKKKKKINCIWENLFGTLGKSSGPYHVIKWDTVNPASD